MNNKIINYNFSFLKEYNPNKTFLLGIENINLIKNKLKKYKLNNLNYTNTKLKEMFLIDLAYSSCYLEWNNYSKEEVINFIFKGKEGINKTKENTIMVKNHIQAISFILKFKKDIYNKNFLYNKNIFQFIHSLLAKDLIKNNNLGCFRTEIVKIWGSKYIPLQNKFQIEEEFDLFLEKLNKIKEPLEQSFFILIFISYLQSFIDVNKRTWRIWLNLPLLFNNLPFSSLINTTEKEYKYSLLETYEKK